MTRCRFASPGAPVDGFEPHCPHQPSDTFPVAPVALALQPRSYLARPIERGGQILTVNQLHKSQILLGDSFRLVVQARTADVQQPTLTYY